MSKLVFKELYIFSIHEKRAKKIDFVDGVNIISSNKENGSKKGKSTLMKSLYHSLGADCKFSKKFDADEKVFILQFYIDGKLYIIYRAGRLFKLFNQNDDLLVYTNNRHELAKQLKEYFNFAVKLKNQNNEIEIASPAYNYILYFLDQDYYQGSKFESFKGLQEYSDYKKNLLFYHLGLIDDKYFDLEKEKSTLNKKKILTQGKLDLNNNVLEKINSKLSMMDYSTEIDTLNNELELISKEYNDYTQALSKIKMKIIELKNEKLDITQSIKSLKKLNNKNNKDIKIINNNRCPYCHSNIDRGNGLLVEKYNANEDIVFLLNDLFNSLEIVNKKISDKMNEYKSVLDKLNLIKNRINIKQGTVRDIVKKEGLLQVREEINKDKLVDLNELDTITKNLKLNRKELTKYNNRSKQLDKDYLKLIDDYKVKYSLKELDNMNISSVCSSVELHGSSKCLITVIWFSILLQLKDKYNPNAIKFPRVFDSPNNTEADDQTLEAVMDFLLLNKNMNNQLIVSTLGFEKIKHRYSEDINIIELDNEKYKLLNENDYNKYYKYLFKLASINKDI